MNKVEYIKEYTSVVFDITEVCKTNTRYSEHFGSPRSSTPLV